MKFVFNDSVLNINEKTLQTARTRLFIGYQINDGNKKTIEAPLIGNEPTAVNFALSLTRQFAIEVLGLNGNDIRLRQTKGGNGVILTYKGKEFLSLRNPEEQCNKTRLNRDVKLGSMHFYIRHGLAALENLSASLPATSTTSPAAGLKAS